MRNKRIFSSKGSGVVIAALLVAITGNVASHAGTSAALDQTIRIPGEIPAFFVGPIDDGDPATPDPHANSDGVKNLALTVSASRAGDVVQDATVGAVTNCAADARLNTLLKITVGGSSSASAALYLEYDKPTADGGTSHVWVNSAGEESSTKTSFAQTQSTTPHTQRTLQVPVCVR